MAGKGWAPYSYASEDEDNDRQAPRASRVRSRGAAAAPCLLPLAAASAARGAPTFKWPHPRAGLPGPHLLPPACSCRADDEDFDVDEEMEDEGGACGAARASERAPRVG